jgi:hypothetical protein
MSARGVDFLENWIGANVPVAGDPSQARKLAQKLVVDAMIARVRVSDLELGDTDAAPITTAGRFLPLGPLGMERSCVT